MGGWCDTTRVLGVRCQKQELARSDAGDPSLASFDQARREGCWYMSLPMHEAKPSAQLHQLTDRQLHHQSVGKQQQGQPKNKNKIKKSIKNPRKRPQLHPQHRARVRPTDSERARLRCCNQHLQYLPALASCVARLRDAAYTQPRGCPASNRPACTNMAFD